MKALFERVGVFTTPALALVILIGACYVFFSEPAGVSAAQDAQPNRTFDANFEFSGRMESIQTQDRIGRCQFPGGWLVVVLSFETSCGYSMSDPIFISDPDHSWGKGVEANHTHAAEHEEARRLKYSEVFEFDRK